MPTIGEAVHGLQTRLFVGRQRELARFQVWLEAETPLPEILDVSGPGGVGKTALLGAFRRCAHQHGRPVVWVDGRDLRPPAEIMRVRRTLPHAHLRPTYPHCL